MIVLHRLIEELPYFLRADHAWTEQTLITPLLNDDGASLALWRAIARRTHFTDVLKIIGSAMAERATDLRLGRETRQRLVFSLVVDALHAFRASRAPAVPNSRVQQMLARSTMRSEHPLRTQCSSSFENFPNSLLKISTPLLPQICSDQRRRPSFGTCGHKSVRWPPPVLAGRSLIFRPSLARLSRKPLQ